MPIRRRLLCFVLVVAVAVLAEAPAQAATPAVAIAALNAQRAANGIPATVTENPTWSADCAEHDAYMRANKLLTHDETAGSPGFSNTGAYIGPNSVLAYRDPPPFDWTVNPWANAPYHLAQVLQPGLRSAGYADNGNYACMSTRPGTDPSGLDGVFTYPGNGRTGVPFAQAASELPSTPQQAVGIAAGTTTGPNLLVFGSGLGGTTVHVTSATMSPSVPLRWVDNLTPGVGSRIPSGAILVPTAPLRPNTRYTVHVTLQGVRSTTHDWSFTTGRTKLGNVPKVTKVSARFSRSARRTAHVSGTGTGRITLTVKVGGRKPVRKIVRASSRGVFTGSVRASASGRATVCVISGRVRLCAPVKL